MTALFVDVSYHDWDRRGGALDWAAIAAAGLGGVMCARASYGDPQVFSPPSPRFGDYMAGAKANGYTARGAYHNLIRGDAASIARQVDLLRSTMDRYGATWAMADIEAYPELVTRGLVSDWATVQRFHDRWYAVEPRVMAWYIGRGFWAGNVGSPSLVGLRGPLIGPRYPGVTGAPASAYVAAGGDGGNGWAAYGGRVPDIWQYSSTVTVPGASSKTDVNAYRGSLAALVALLTGGTTPPAEDDMYAQYDRDQITATWGKVQQIQGQVTALRSVVDALAAVITKGGGTVDTAAILAGVDARLAALDVRQTAELRDAVADLGEGGAAQVRADAG